jgi:hypothetical protein
VLEIDREVLDMKIKEEAIKELKGLKPGELLQVYDLILSLKGRQEKQKENKYLRSYQRVREALKGCQGSLSGDILSAREDRV